MNYLPTIIAFILLFMDVPVGYALLTSALVYFGLMDKSLTMTSVVQKVISSNMSNSLITIPCFLMVGTVMNHCGITKRLMRWCNAMIGHVEGGLAQVNVLLSTVNGGMCGSSAADAAMQCKMLVPEMTKQGYPLAFSAAVTAATSLIAPMIPPGNGLLLYSSMTDTPVIRMFVAGYIPGLLMCVTDMAVVKYVCHKKHYQTRTAKATWRERARATVDAMWSILVMVILIVGIRMGLFNVQEGAVVIILLCLIIGVFIYREIHLKDIPMMFVETFHLSANIMFMLMGSLLFGFYLSWARIPQNITALLMSVSSSKWVFLIIAMGIMLVLGMLMDATAMLLVVTPILFPISQEYGINPIQFGILELINMYIGSLTPPVGGIMYTVCKITKCPMPDFIREAKIFIFAMMILLVLVAVFPQISTFLPTLIYG